MESGYRCLETETETETETDVRATDVCRARIAGREPVPLLQGLQVHVWTVNDRHRTVRTLDLGVDGIMADHIEALRAAPAERGARVGGAGG